MAHQRTRFLESQLLKLLGLSPLVGIMGHRQVGKTTLLTKIAKSYFTLDDAGEFQEATRNPKKYLADRAGQRTALDECQNVPQLFPALKEVVRKDSRPGQFILSGSVRFTSRKAIRESLTGRIINLELLPLLISELHEKPLPGIWRKMTSMPEFVKSWKVPDTDSLKLASFEKYFKAGGLPGLCFIRDDSFRAQKADSQIETLLDRDLRLVVPTSLPYPPIRLLLESLADRQGLPISFADLRKATDISIPTIKKLLYGFESIFLIRSIPIEGDGKGPVFYFEDMAELALLRRRELSLTEKITHFLMIHLRGEWSYSGHGLFRPFHYQTRAGVVVPIGIHDKDMTLGVIPLDSDSPSRVEMAGADSFLKRYNRSKVVFVTKSKMSKVLDGRKLIVGLPLTV